MTEQCNTYNYIKKKLLDKMCLEHAGKSYYDKCRKKYEKYIEMIQIN
jgi:hypothetical protein